MPDNQYYKLIERGQDLFDLCLQEYGDVRALFLLLEDNPALDLTRELIAGEQVLFRIEVPDELPIDKNVMDYFRTNTIRVNMKEGQLLLDGNYNTTVGGAIDGALPDLTPAGAGGQFPNPLTGVQTASGVSIRTRTGGLLLTRHAPVLLASTSQTLLTSLGSTLQIRPPLHNYLQTSNGAYIQTASSQHILLR